MNGEEYDAERKLCEGLDSLISDIDKEYGSELSGEDELLRRLSNINLRKQLIAQIKDTVRCRKLSERFMDEQLAERSYEVRTKVNASALAYELSETVRV